MPWHPQSWQFRGNLLFLSAAHCPSSVDDHLAGSLVIVRKNVLLCSDCTLISDSLAQTVASQTMLSGKYLAVERATYRIIF